MRIDREEMSGGKRIRNSWEKKNDKQRMRINKKGILEERKRRRSRRRARREKIVEEREDERLWMRREKVNLKMNPGLREMD